MADDYQVSQQYENGHHHDSENGTYKPLLELYVKASGIDSKRIGACLFCQEFWMELYALYEIGLVRVEVKTVNINSEAFKRNFLGAQPPIMIEQEKNATYTDNREIEGRIFHLAKEFQVPLFEKDQVVEKKIESLYRNFKLFVRAKAEYDKEKAQSTSMDDLPAQIKSTYNKVVEQLATIDQ
uniref:CLIC N-terminal domain-containing protein n=1 Tax=Plectus sambesii TaxID=2011161 RepID=A0A914XJ20_9BILA